MPRYILSLILLFAVLFAPLRASFPGLGGKYPSGNGCIWLLIQCDGDTTNGGDVAFTHFPTNPTGYYSYGDESSAEEYWIYILPQWWGVTALGGTGICWVRPAWWPDFWINFWTQWSLYGDVNG